jgi:D-alanyl-D-alanine carboxypeptidase/D-alanyl-D-alanine-endopeptidase (penicillin-binding protein 4)
MRARTLLRAALILAALIPATAVPAVSGPAAAEHGAVDWRDRIQGLVAGKPISVAIGNDGGAWYFHRAGTQRPPASNEKLLLSMALMSRFALDRTIPTRVMAADPPENGVLRGNLWIVGAGDPETGGSALSSLADQLVAAGLTKVRGRIVGATTPFVRDWWAPGWRDYFPSVYVQIPTALTFRRNESPNGRHVSDPERRAAAFLTRLLERRGVVITRSPRMAPAPGGLHALAAVRSERLLLIVRTMNKTSSNLRAEVLGKYLGRDRFRQPSIDGGARAIHAFVRARGFEVTTYDSSGLSYANRISAGTILRLLWFADSRPWGEPLRNTLPIGGQGTLKGRLEEVQVHAKTGTLIDVSALSGWVWLERSQEWAEFSILSRGISASSAKQIEDRIVRIVANRANDPTP